MKTLFLLQYILRTDNLEKVPNTAACRAGTAAAACGPGFFDAALPAGPAGGSRPLIFTDSQDKWGRKASSGQQGGGGGELAAHLSTSSSLADSLLYDRTLFHLGAWPQAAGEPAVQVTMHVCSYC